MLNPNPHPGPSPTPKPEPNPHQVPMLNPDGVFVGNYRCNALGLDLSR